MFQCSSASRKFLNSTPSANARYLVSCFSALQRAENSSITCPRQRDHAALIVSVLFSEPKIPQFLANLITLRRVLRFSALQRAENSSIQRCDNRCQAVGRLFQCSSASRKFLNFNRTFWRPFDTTRFSALQRAENSSIRGAASDRDAALRFQCSSASRKFLN